MSELLLIGADAAAGGRLRRRDAYAHPHPWGAAELARFFVATRTARIAGGHYGLHRDLAEDAADRFANYPEAVALVLEALRPWGADRLPLCDFRPAGQQP